MSARFYNNWDFPPNYYEFDPTSLMTAGDGSFWYDFGDWNSMFQDDMMTEPVTAVGQHVAVVRDKGPNGFHLGVDGALSSWPVVAIQGGYKCLDFDSTTVTRMLTPDVPMALGTCHGYIIFESDLTNTFQRLLSVSDTGADTAGTRAIAIHTHDANGWFGTRAKTTTLDTRYPGTGASALGLYEYELSGGTATVWKDGTVGDITDASTGGMDVVTNRKIVVGTMSNLNAPSTTGPFDGRIWNIVHLGNIPSAANNTKMRNWLNTYRI